MGSKGSNTTTTSSSPNPQAMDAYQKILAQAQGVAATPYTPYGGELTAPVNAQQSTGIANINSNWNYAQPYLQTAAGYATDAATPLTTAQIQQYMSPYTQDVVNATQAQFNNQNEQQRQGVVGNAISHGAMGGNREAIAEAELAGQQQLSQAPVIAGLRNQAYSSGLNTALTEQQARAQGAYSLGNLGVSGQNAALTGANAQVGAGTLQQSTQQAQDAAAYQQFVNQQAYPFQTLQWLAGIGTGVGSQMGGTSSTTAPKPNPLAQWLGLGAAAVGAAGQSGMFGSGSPSAADSYGGGSASAGDAYGGSAAAPLPGLTAADYGHRAGGVVRGLADGGVPGDLEPWAAEAHDWVPNLGITPGKGAPPPPKPTAAASGDGGIGDIAKLAMKFAPMMLAANGGVVPDAPPTNGAGAVMAGSPYGSGHGWIPRMEMARGHGAPQAPGVAPSQQSQPSPSTLAQQAKEIGSLAKVIQNPGSAEPQEPSVPDEARYGGAVTRFASGGVANLPFHDRIIVPRLADGGSPYDTDYFDNTFAAPIRHDADSYRTLATPGAYGDYSKKIIADSDYRPDVAELPMPRPRPAGIAPAYDLPPEIYAGSSRPAQAQQTAMSFADDGTAPPAAPPRRDAMTYAPAGEAPPPARGVAPRAGFDFSSDSKLWPSLMAAGFGAMASRSPFLGTAVGEGGLAGMQTYSNERQREDKINSEVKKLSQEAEFAQKRLDLATRPYKEQTADQKARSTETAEYHKLLGSRMKLRPTGTMVETPDGPHPIFIDGNTGQSIDGITGEPVETGAKIITAPGKAGATQILARELMRDREEQRKTDPSIPPLSMEEAVGLAHRSPDADRGTARRLSMAQAAWGKWTSNPANMAKKDAPENKLEFWEQRYGVTGAAPAPAAPGAPSARAPAAPAPTKTLQPIDQQALDWANANPTDPRSAAIKKRLGVQ